MDYLEKLHLVENNLGYMLKHPTLWKGMDILYHPPRVERIWATFPYDEELRVSLHIIHKPALDVECLYHPHPWPSGMRILHGGYEMGIGYGVGLETPPEACKVILAAGSQYEMNHPDGWHYVKPLSSVSLSLMVSGKPWSREMPIEPDKDKNIKMTPEQVATMIKVFSTFY